MSRLVIFIAILLSAGCAYRSDDMWVSDIEKEQFSFLEVNHTTKEDVLERFGTPTCTFEDEKILVYQMTLFKDPIFVSTGFTTSELKAYRDFQVGKTCVQMENPWTYEVFLVFDDRSVLVERRIRALFAERFHALREHKVE